MENQEKLGKLSSSTRKAFERVIARCEKASVDYEWQDGGEAGYAFVVNIEKGTGKRKLLLFDEVHAEKLLDFEFEKYVFVGGYGEAICCCGEGYAEAIVRAIGPRSSETVVLGTLAGAKTYNDCRAMMWRNRGKDVRTELTESGGKGVRISVGRASKALRGMVQYTELPGAGLSVRVEGLEVSSSEEVGEQLGRLVNSLFFELKRKRGIELFVRKEYGVEAFTWDSNPWRGGRGEWDLEFPKLEYDKEAVELYWHAVSAYRMPLLQYLGYYQVLEFYFGKYWVLKDGVCEVSDENDIVKRGVHVSRNAGRPILEKDLLCSTVRGCISREELMSRLGNPLLEMYFDNASGVSKSGMYKTVSQFGVSWDDQRKDIREQLAERIYDIRCKIVHTKEGDKRGRILPFTEEENLLQMFDLAMIAGLADNVLIANSRELSIR